ncbi:SigE family RNA polymerase sigma factor [Dactylosporangium sp. NBC_01737]|uniref:SigE family RNA polymerase sigma factor n=1 Tax=Dactylosporangium sp. NBC_01737 TaxID=2975959 RepID=UPI002E0F8245|nr:SigE family RNA polymerase sigma factor [Dactylosporangium sp. NBC_01737]
MRSDSEADYTTYVSARLTALHRAAYLLCGGDKDRADDVVQVTITKLYRSWRRASRADNVDAYVHRMLVRTYIDERRRLWSLVQLFPHTEDGLTGVDEPYGAVDDRGVVVAALRRLPPRQRAVLVLRFLLDRPVEEVAETLGCSVGTVKSQSSRGLAVLRAALLDHPKTIGMR